MVEGLARKRSGKGIPSRQQTNVWLAPRPRYTTGQCPRNTIENKIPAPCQCTKRSHLGLMTLTARLEGLDICKSIGKKKLSGSVREILTERGREAKEPFHARLSCGPQHLRQIIRFWARPGQRWCCSFHVLRLFALES